MNLCTITVLFVAALLIALLIISFNRIYRLKITLSELEDKVSKQNIYRTSLIKKQMDLSILQEQINPHFLYNTLESIRSQAELTDQTEIATAIETLALYLRYCISSQGEPVHLFEELQNIQDYYQIIRFRFFDRIQLIVDIDDTSILQSYLPQLTLQPIVENAINHGLKDKISDAVITISASRSDNIIYLKISDNGCGMNEKQLLELEDKIAHPVEIIHENKKGHGLALPNVHHRIQLIFGNAYGLHVQSIPGEGTDIYIEYPINYAKIIEGQNERIHSSKGHFH